MPLIVKYPKVFSTDPSISSPPPWPWWDKGDRLLVCPMDAYAASKVGEVCTGLESVTGEFNLPLVVEAAKKTTCTLVANRLEQFTVNGIIRCNSFRDVLNKTRQQGPDLRNCLVVLFNGDRLQLEDDNPADGQPPEWGVTLNDGLMFLRLEPCQPLRNLVRHEMGHLLGVGTHHRPPSDCVMVWECTYREFCQECKETIQEVCQIGDRKLQEASEPQGAQKRRGSRRIHQKKR